MFLGSGAWLIRFFVTKVGEFFLLVLLCYTTICFPRWWQTRFINTADGPPAERWYIELRLFLEAVRRPLNIFSFFVCLGRNFYQISQRVFWSFWDVDKLLLQRVLVPIIFFCEIHIIFILVKSFTSSFLVQRLFQSLTWYDLWVFPAV